MSRPRRIEANQWRRRFAKQIVMWIGALPSCDWITDPSGESVTVDQLTSLSFCYPLVTHLVPNRLMEIDKDYGSYTSGRITSQTNWWWLKVITIIAKTSTYTAKTWNLIANIYTFISQIWFFISQIRTFKPQIHVFISQIRAFTPQVRTFIPQLRTQLSQIRASPPLSRIAQPSAKSVTICYGN